VKIGVLGLGSIGMRHAKNVLALGHEVDAYDPVGMAGQVFVPEIRVMHRDHVLILSKAIVVASPSIHHGVDLQDAIHSGCHVLVEKPFGYDCPPLLDGFLQATRQKAPGQIVATGFNLRFHSCVKKAKELVPDLGELSLCQLCGKAEDRKRTLPSETASYATGVHMKSI